MPKRSTSSFVIAFSLFLVITILLCTPGSKFPKLGWQDKIWFDKWVHIFLFMMLVVSWCRYYSFRNSQSVALKKSFLTITILSVVYGITMEMIQEYFIPNRSFEIPDIIADTIGAMAGYFISVRNYLKK